MGIYLIGNISLIMSNMKKIFLLAAALMLTACNENDSRRQQPALTLQVWKWYDLMSRMTSVLTRIPSISRRYPERF